MAHLLHAIDSTTLIMPPRDGLVFIAGFVPIVSMIMSGDNAIMSAAIPVLGWCVLLGAQALYAGLALNEPQAAADRHLMKPNLPALAVSSPGHLAAMLESGCDDNRHHRRLCMSGGAITAANLCVMIVAGITAYGAFGPLWAFAGPGLVFALAVHSYDRAIRYAIWGLSAVVLGYAIRLILAGDAPVIARIDEDIAMAPFLALGLSGLVSVIAYHFTIIANLRHIAWLAFTYAGLCVVLVLGIAQPAITNLALLALLVFAPGLCALSAKTRRQCRYQFYGYGDTSYS